MKTKEYKSNNWIEIHPTARPKRTEQEEKERLKYWSWFYNQKNRVKATCHSF